MQEPANVSRKLLRFRTWQEHAVIERMQKAALGNPSLLVHQNAMHDLDLAGGTNEAHKGDFQPNME